MTHIRIKRGLDIRLSGAATSAILEQPQISIVGLSGLDYPEIRPSFLVEPGQSVVAGQPILRDRKRPEIVIVSPATGTVSAAVRRDPGSAAFLVEISVSSIDPATIDVPPNWRSGDTVREVLLASGLWTCLLERPFGRLPDPDGVPDAILVTAMPADTLAPDAAAIVAAREADFATGLEALGRLADCPVRVCQKPGPSLAGDSATFSGVYPAGLPGTHVHRLYPVGNGRRVWTLNYQDVIAIGRLFNAGELDSLRTVALSGPGVRSPGLLRVPIGARIEDMVRGHLRDGEQRIVSGPFLSGREAQYLGRAHLQVCVLPEKRSAGAFARLRPRGQPDPIVPIAAHQTAFPFDLPAVPLLRALAVGDTESARALGCLELLEEDIAILSYVCPSNNDYAPMLRAVLDELRRET